MILSFRYRSHIASRPVPFCFAFFSLQGLTSYGLARERRGLVIIVGIGSSSAGPNTVLLEFWLQRPSKSNMHD